MLKQGYDHFEVTRLEPKVDVCEKHYVFDAESNEQVQRRRPLPGLPGARGDREPRCATSSAATTFRPPNWSTAVRRPLPATTGVDGGMNKVFLAALKGTGRDFVDSDGRIAAFNPPPKAARHDPGARQSAARSGRQRFDRQPV